MKRRLRVHANLGFWKPCLVATNVSTGQMIDIENAWQMLMAAIPLLGGKLYYTIDGQAQ